LALSSSDFNIHGSDDWHAGWQKALEYFRFEVEFQEELVVTGFGAKILIEHPVFAFVVIK